MNSEISYRQVDNLVLSFPKYKHFTRVSRYSKFMNELGKSRKYKEWRDFKVYLYNLIFNYRLKM